MESYQLHSFWMIKKTKDDDDVDESDNHDYDNK